MTVSTESCDHEWKFISDSQGDSDVINGIGDCSYWECTLCGSTDAPDNLDPPDYGSDYL